MGQVRTLDPIISVCPGGTQPTFDSVRICLKPKLLVEVNHLRLQEQQGRGSGVNKCGGVFWSVAAMQPLSFRQQ